MDDISTAVITSISHGHTETLLHLGLKPDGVPDNDARVLYEAAVELLRDKKKINRLALMVRVSGKLQDIKSVDDIFSLNGTGDVPPEDVVKRVRDNYLQAEVDKLTKRASELRGDKTKEVSQWLPIFAQKLQSLTLHARAYDSRPSAHRGQIVAPVMFRSKLQEYNKIFAGKSGDGGGYRGGWYTVWIGPTGRGKTTNAYTIGADVISQGKRITFISKELQNQVEARLLLALSGLTIEEVNKRQGMDMQPQIDADGHSSVWYDTDGQVLGDWHRAEIRQIVMGKWETAMESYLALYPWEYLNRVRDVISWEDSDVFIVDYIGIADNPDRYSIQAGLGRVSQGLESSFHETKKSGHAFFQMSDSEKVAYEKNRLHQVIPYGAATILHPADQAIQTRISDIPDQQHYLRTKCRAGGQVEEYKTHYDKSRWIYTDLPERLPL